MKPRQPISSPAAKGTVSAVPTITPMSSPIPRSADVSKRARPAVHAMPKATSPTTTGKTSAIPMAFHPCRPPKRKETSAKPSLRMRRAATDAMAGTNIRAMTRANAPPSGLVLMIVPSRAESGTRVAK